MTDERVLLWNADCTPSVNEFGEQNYVEANLIEFVYDSNGAVLIDSCGHEVWAWKPATTTQPPVTTRPPLIFPPPQFKKNTVPWKLLLAVFVAFALAAILLK